MTRSIKDMTRGSVANGTREWFRVTSDEDVLAAVDAYDTYLLWKSYDDDNAQWTLDNPDTTPPEKAQFAYPAAVADRGNITDPEGVFVELRFFATDDNPNEIDLPVNVGWLQVTANVTTSAGFFGDLLAVFNAIRALTHWDPSP